MPLFDNTLKALELSLGAASQRQQVLSNNLANVNTPLYKRQDVSFDGVLAKALDSENSGEMDAVSLDELKPEVTTDESTSMRADGNNVDVDNEMASLAENNVRYNALVQLAAKKLNMIQYVATDGRS